MHRPPRSYFYAGLLSVLLLPNLARAQAGSQSPHVPSNARNTEPAVTLDEALREARNANAHLPVAALGIDIARTSIREVNASRFPNLALSGSVNAGGPLAYTTSQGAAQVVGAATLFDGGLRRATLNAATYRLQGAGAGYRVVEKDVDLAVRLWFSEFLRAENEIAFREQGIERLMRYLSQVQGRRAAGQPVGSDLLTTQVRLGTEEAALADAKRALDEARLQLNDLMGRVPDAPLSVAPLPPPGLPKIFAGSPWLATPDVRAAEANTAASQAAIAATRSERKPQLQVSANVGALPVFGRDAGTGPNSGSGRGGAVLFSLSWPFLDGGVFQARLDRARLVAQQAQDSEIVVKRQVRFSSQLAATQLTRLYQQVETWNRNIPTARDAYLQAQSMYTGGAATALEVLDAYTSWINANQAYTDAVVRYRLAEANYIRWGSP
ncbi:MAG: TolC family protein [Gemmatimonadaceae bacterium]